MTLTNALMRLRHWQTRVDLQPSVHTRWFLAAAVGLLGLINVLPAALTRAGIDLSFSGTVTSLAEDMTLGVMGSLPETAAGAMLLAMSIGLVWRSRFAWAMTVLMTLAILLRRLIHHPHVGPLVVFIGLLLFALVVMRRSFDRSSLAAESSFAVLSLLSLLGFAVFGTYLLGQDFAPPVTDLLTALYFSVATLSTVGYGDIIPKTPEARVFVMSVIVIGVTIFAASLSTVVVPLVNKRLRRTESGGETMSREKHTIVVGDTTLAQNTARAIRARGLPVTVISAQPVSATDVADADLDVVVGDPTDVRVLARAGVGSALSLMALLDDDAENAFVILAAREVGTAAKTTVSVRTADNIGRVRLARPDVIISPELFSSEILAMVVNGEPIDNSTLVDRLLNQVGEAPVK